MVPLNAACQLMAVEVAVSGVSMARSAGSHRTRPVDSSIKRSRQSLASPR